MSLKELYPAIETVYHTLQPVYAPSIESCCAAAGLSSPEIFLLYSSPSYYPDPVNVKRMQIRTPYASPEYQESLLGGLQAKGYLEKSNLDEYSLSTKGYKTIEKIRESIAHDLNAIQPLSVIELMDLASRLKDYADACLSAPEPPGAWCIQQARRLDAGPGASIMVRIEQFLTELCAFRDDAHIAAWKGYESNGHAWDILTLLWKENSKTIEEINTLLKRRGNSLQQTHAAVDQIIKKGWVTIDREIVHITPFGTDIRNIAEETTDRYYYLPFKVFSNADIEKTIELINKFREAIPAA